MDKKGKRFIVGDHNHNYSSLPNQGVVGSTCIGIIRSTRYAIGVSTNIVTTGYLLLRDYFLGSM